MKQEQKSLLLKDLCARLPYGVKCIVDGLDDCTLMPSDIEEERKIKPYLRPMSSMSDEEKKEYTSYCFEQPFLQKDKKPNLGSVPMCIDWLNTHHFDYRGLIKKGIAIEAPEDMYNIK